MCFISSHATLFPPLDREEREEEERGGEGMEQEKWRAEGKKLRRHAVMDWPGPITSFVSICAEYCS